jgi:hypothetical protein
VSAELAARLRERLPEIQAAVATRVYAISDPHEVADQAYLQGLDAALAAAVEHRLEVLEAGERHAPPVPTELLAQARLDARDGVPLDTVMRRYFAGNALFGDFLVEEAERAEVPGSVLRVCSARRRRSAIASSPPSAPSTRGRRGAGPAAPRTGGASASRACSSGSSSTTPSSATTSTATTSA